MDANMKKWLARIGTIIGGTALGVIGALCVQTKEDPDEAGEIMETEDLSTEETEVTEEVEEG